MTETEEKTEEKTEETERTPKNADDMTTAARAILDSLSDTGFTRDETICILAIASALMNGEVFMTMMMEHATLLKVPVKRPQQQKPSMN